MERTMEYTIMTESGAMITGQASANGCVRVVESLKNAKLRSVKATVKLSISDTTKIFHNGYQNWTYSPEYDKTGRTRGLKHLPSFLRGAFQINCYGDYHFVDYPYKKGITHGESWCYFRDGDHWLLFGSLDEKPGYTLFQYDANAGVLTIERDCAGVRVNGDFHAFDLYIGEGTEAEVFDGWFDAMGKKPLRTEPMVGYSSWYNRYQDINDSTITDDLIGAKTLLKPGDLFQIDDGWEPFVGDWLIMHNGKPWMNGSNWGGFYSLDIDKPEVVAYVNKVLDRVLHEWGFDLVKLDFLYGAAPFGTETESRAARMIRAMDILRKACEGKMILGCGVPLWPAFGKVEYCRVGCDVGLDWNDTKLMQATHRERVSTKQSIEDTIFRRQLTGRAFMGDPDVFFLREQNCKLTPEEKEKLYTVNALLGGFLLTSDALNAYTEEQKAKFRAIRQMKERATDIKVDADDGVTIRYTLDGEKKSLRIL